MDFKTFFFSWDGRSARKTYWIGIATIYVLVLVLSFAAGTTGLGEAVRSGVLVRSGVPVASWA